MSEKTDRDHISFEGCQNVSKKASNSWSQL